MSLTQAVILERYKKHLANEFDLTIEQIETVLKDEVLLHDIAKLNPKELKLLIKASDSKFYQAFASYIELLKREWLGIFGVQWGWLSKLKPKAKPRYDVPLEIATGLTLDDICKGFCDDSTKRIIGAIRLAHHKGLSNNDLLKLIRGTKANNFADGIIAYNKRQAQTIARTGTAIVANQAKREYINANKDDILGIKVIATLDARTCLVAGTLIDTPSGQKPVEEIMVGDSVIGGSGQAKTVSSTLKSKTNKLCKITLSDGRNIICTQDHKWWTGTGWIDAKDLIIGDILPKSL